MAVIRKSFLSFSNDRFGFKDFLLPFSPHKPFKQEGQEVWEGIELAVETNVLVAEFYAVFYVGELAVLCSQFGE